MRGIAGLILVLWCTMAAAVQAPDRAGAPGPAQPASQDTLFLLLAQSKSEAEAKEIANRIWHNWFKSGDEQVDDWMQQAMRQRNNFDFSGAIETLNRVIERMPDYAEAWNQRATAHFYRGDAEKSLEDVARTLELEPRHFGALSGRAVIRLQQGKAALALQNMIEASKIHPFLPERALFPGLQTRPE